MLEDVEVCIYRLPAVEIEPVFTLPSKGLAGHPFETGQIDSAPAEHAVGVVAEVFSDDRNHAHLGEERCGNGEVRGCTANDAVRLAEWRSDRIERNRTDRENRLHALLVGG